MIKYLGSKRLLIPLIGDVVSAVPDVRTVVDFFSGTARVGHALKRMGFRVLANDHLAYAHTLATCYVAADRKDVHEDAARQIARLNRLAAQAGKPVPAPAEAPAEAPAVAPAEDGASEGYFTATFCRRSRFFRPENGVRIEAVREAIAELAPRAHLEAVLLTSLMEAADRVDSTTGVQMAYLKSWAPRAFNPLVLRVPDILPRSPWGAGEAHCLDAVAAAARLTGDLAYIDPPYNQHSYLGNYHIWETLVRWDSPEPYGVACKRIDCRTRKSDFNSRVKARNALADFVRRVRCPHLVVSFNDEGHVARAELEEMLGERGEVATLAVDYRRYVGAQIGIHDPQGRKVGKVGRLRNREFIFLASPSGLDDGIEAVRRMARDGRARRNAQPDLFAPSPMR